MSTLSDAGGVAARKGFKYQDHVAAKYLLQMIDDPQLLSIECETSDDIVLNWKKDNIAYPEYVQVKTTEGDRKWNQTEVLTRKPKDKPTSLIEKSLLCDTGGENAVFKIVSQRDVAKTLVPLTIPIEKRTGQISTDINSLAAKFAKKHKTNSANNNDLKYWVLHAVWCVTGSMNPIKASNENFLLKLAENSGIALTHSNAKNMYEEVTYMAAEAAVASKIDIQQRRKHNTYLPTRKDISKDFVLRGAVCCSSCGKPYRGAWSKGEYKKYAYYVCQTKGCENYARSVRRDDMEGEFAQLLQSIQPLQQLADTVNTMFTRAWQLQQDKAGEQAQRFKEDLISTE